MNATHMTIKARKSNQGQLLGNNLPFVSHTRIILGRIIESLLNEVWADIPKTLPPFLYFLVNPNYLILICRRARLV